VKFKLEAGYTLEILAQTKEEAIREAYQKSIPVRSLYDIEKKVVRVMRMRQTGNTVQFEVLQSDPR
jgi:hypothetical protein